MDLFTSEFIRDTKLYMKPVGRLQTHYQINVGGTSGDHPFHTIQLTHDGPNHSPKRVGLNSCCTASSKGIRRRSGTLYTSSEINSSSVEQQARQRPPVACTRIGKQCNANRKKGLLPELVRAL